MSRSILVVGAGPGIGLAAAERFGREGWTVILAARNPRALDAMTARLVGEGVDAHALVLDATDPAALRAGMRTADRLAGGLGTVLYNAAIVRQQDLFSMTDAEVGADVAGNIRIATATVATLVAPDSPEARDVADLLWSLATDVGGAWERTYPRAA